MEELKRIHGKTIFRFEEIKRSEYDIIYVIYFTDGSFLKIESCGYEEVSDVKFSLFEM